MSNVLIDQLTAGAVGTTIVGADLVEIEHDPTGTPASKKSTINQLNLAMNVPCCSVSRAAAQTVSNVTITPAQFSDADTYDTDTMHDPASNNSRIIAKTAGVYLLTAAAVIGAGTNGYNCGFIVNGGATGYGVVVGVNNITTGSGFLCSAQIKLAVNDYVEFYLYQTSGGNLDFTLMSCQAVRVAIG